MKLSAPVSCAKITSRFRPTLQRKSEMNFKQQVLKNCVTLVLALCTSGIPITIKAQQQDRRYVCYVCPSRNAIQALQPDHIIVVSPALRPCCYANAEKNAMLPNANAQCCGKKHACPNTIAAHVLDGNTAPPRLCLGSHPPGLRTHFPFAALPSLPLKSRRARAAFWMNFPLCTFSNVPGEDDAAAVAAVVSFPDTVPAPSPSS